MAKRKKPPPHPAEEYIEITQHQYNIDHWIGRIEPMRGEKPMGRRERVGAGVAFIAVGLVTLWPILRAIGPGFDPAILVFLGVFPLAFLVGGALLLRSARGK